jgi:CheY-like chemotaxis protein
MAQMLKPLIGETIELDTSLDPVLGRVKADPAQIEQIILNLAVNARDAMPQGGRLTIETGNVELDPAFVETHPGSSAGPHTMLSVRDTGTGMSPDVQAHLFEPFFTTKGVGKGTGLGLATVYGIVKQHGGYIRIESAPGAGTAVRIYFARVAPLTDAAPAPATDAPPAVGSGTVLVVEDEGELRDLATEVLGIAGYTVLSAGSPSAALDIANHHAGPIHLLLTDVVMPEMSGRDLADRLVRARPAMKILYMSGYTDDAIVHHGVLDPGTVLLQKPFTPDKLTRMVGDLLA